MPNLPVISTVPPLWFTVFGLLHLRTHYWFAPSFSVPHTLISCHTSFPNHSTPSRSLQPVSVSYRASLLVFPLHQWDWQPPHPHWWSADGASWRAVPHAGQSSYALKWKYLKTKLFFNTYQIIKCQMSSPVPRRPAWALLTLLLLRWLTQALAASEVSWTLLRRNQYIILKLRACRSKHLMKIVRVKTCYSQKHNVWMKSITYTMQYCIYLCLNKTF